MPLRAAAASVAGLAGLMLMSACGGGAGGESSVKETSVTPTEQLLTRPTAEQAATMYQGQLVRIRTALTKLAPNVSWDDGAPLRTRENLCRRPLGDVNGASVFGYATGGGGAIPDEDWDQAIKTTAAVLKSEGYDRMQVTVNKPGLHNVSFFGRYGSLINISGEKSTGIDLLESGCFLDAEAHAAAKKKSATGTGG